MRGVVALVGALLLAGLASSAPAKLPRIDLVYVDGGALYADYSTDSPADQTDPNETNVTAANRHALRVEGSEPRWSPDGLRIVFVKQLGTESSELWSVRVDGKGARRLTHPPEGSRDLHPAWSPAGSQIAFARIPVSGGGSAEIWLAAASGAGATGLVAKAFSDTPSWSPDGSRLAFDRSGGLAVVAADGTGLKSLGKAVGPSWSPDGASIAGSCGGVCLLGADAGGSRKIAARSGALAITWRPDSKRLAFLVCCPKSSLYDTAVDLYTVGADGRGLQRLARGLASGDELANLTAAWSRDGKRFAYVSADPSFRAEIVVRTVGAKPKLLGTGYDLAWRP